METEQTNDTAPRSIPRRVIRVIGSVSAWSLVLGPIAALLLILTARWSFPAELASHFRWHVGIGAVLCLVPLALARQRRKALAVALIAAWGMLPEGVLWLGTPPLEASAPALDIVYANVLRPNEQYEPLLEMLLARDADIVGLVEVSPAWREHALETLGERYPYHAEGLDTDEWSPRTWGSMLFSKTPLAHIDVRPAYNGRRRLRPILRAEVDIAGESLTIQLVHAQRPGRATQLADRKSHFEVLSQPVDGQHQIIVGDLNTTSTSPLFGDLCESAGVRDSRRGFGRLASWVSPRTPPGPFKLKIPHRLRPAITIDHALVSDGLVVLRRGTFVTPGSDHFGLFVRVGVRVLED